MDAATTKRKPVLNPEPCVTPGFGRPDLYGMVRQSCKKPDMKNRFLFCMQSVGLGFLILFAVFAPVALLARSEPGFAGPVLVIAPPWADLSEIIETSGGRQIGPETAPMARFAASDTQQVQFELRLHRAGAWMVIQSATLADLCGIKI